jgi:hypothetical protein
MSPFSTFAVRQAETTAPLFLKMNQAAAAAATATTIRIIQYFFFIIFFLSFPLLKRHQKTCITGFTHSS